MHTIKSPLALSQHVAVITEKSERLDDKKLQILEEFELWPLHSSS